MVPIVVPDLKSYYINLGIKFLMFLGGSTLVVWLFVKKNKKLRNLILKGLAILFVLTAAFVIFLSVKDPIIKWQRRLIPTSVRQTADAYIVSKVGEAYFGKNFIYNKELSSKGSKSSYFIYYDFLPLRQYTDPALIIILVNKDSVEQADFSHGIPECLKDVSLCEFNLTKEDFLNIKKEYFKAGDYIRGIDLNPPNLEIKICPTNTDLFIDYRTKKVAIRPHFDRCQIILP